jgi:NADP-dependent 3-hydroxy acid dehydrogenase YdfG
MVQAPHSDIAWIAGVGASAEPGAALARRFVGGGLKVLLTGRNESRLREVAAEIGASGGAASSLPGDISLPAEVARPREADPLRACLLNAGNVVPGNAMDVTPEQFESTRRGSAHAGYLFVRASLPLLLEAGGGSLL